MVQHRRAAFRRQPTMLDERGSVAQAHADGQAFGTPDVIGVFSCGALPIVGKNQAL